MTRKFGLTASVLALVLLIGSVVSAGGLLSLSGLAAVRLSLDGRDVPSDVPPVIIEGRTMLPVRAVAEALGLEVRWDAATRTVFLTRPEAGRVTAKSGLSAKVQDVSPVISASDDATPTHADVEATVSLKNTTRAAIDLSQYRIVLKDRFGAKVEGRLQAAGGARLGTLAAGGETQAKVVFAQVPVEGAGRMQMVLVGPGGDETPLTSITITIECSWPPLKCRITISLDL